MLSQGNGVPAAVTLTPAILDPSGSSLERFEGMRMQAASLVSVAPTDDFGEIATVLPGVLRPMREPGIPLSDPVPPDPTTGGPDCCIPRFDGNPERIVIDSEGRVDATVISVTSNVTLDGVVGPLDFSFGAYKIVPEVAPTVGPNMTGVPVPVPAADEFTVAGFNIENFAGSETRRKKAALAIRQLMRSPDVIGHIEILDEPTLKGLTDQVNADAVAAGEPNPDYQARLMVALRDDGTPSPQNVGFLVKTSRVRAKRTAQAESLARGNSDFPADPEFTNDATRPERSSDHDMPVAYFRFPPPSADLAIGIVADTATAAAGAVDTFTFTAPVSCPSRTGRSSQPRHR